MASQLLKIKSPTFKTFDYLPPHSEQRGGFIFQNDPGAGALRIEADGYVIRAHPRRELVDSTRQLPRNTDAPHSFPHRRSG